MPNFIFNSNTNEIIPSAKIKSLNKLSNRHKSARCKLLTSANAFQLKYGNGPYLFQTKAMQNKIPHTDQHNPVYDFSGKTILIVDDMLLNLILLEIYFRNTGAALIFANNGSEALNICLSNSPVDIVLMDIQMPVMNGLEATREIRRLNMQMPVIVISAYVQPDDKQRCFDAGCNTFLSKPCNRNDLLKTVNEYINVRDELKI